MGRVLNKVISGEGTKQGISGEGTKQGVLVGRVLNKVY